MMNARPTLQFWFDFGSNYSYLALMRIEELAVRHQVDISLKPFLLGPIFASLGWETSPFVLQQQKGRYTWRDMERQCAKFGLPWNKPTVFPRRALLPLRLAIVAAGEPWLTQFCRAIMHANFVQDRDIDNVAIVAEVLAALSVAPDDWIARAQSDTAKAALRVQSDGAALRGIFGAPTFFINNEMFWGNDRLDDAIAWAQTGKQP